MKTKLLIECVALALLGIFGCSDNRGSIIKAADVIPEDTVIMEGETWKWEPVMLQADEELLRRFFVTHAEYQGSTDFEGPPMVYSCEGKGRRFYWLRGSSESVSWSCIHFENGKFRVADGTGNPFRPQ